MAHAARIDSNGVVREVVVVDDDKFVDSKGKKLGQKVGTFPQDELLNEYMAQLGLLRDNGSGEEWRFTSYNGNFRGVFAGAGFTYNRQTDQFMPPEIPEAEDTE